MAHGLETIKKMNNTPSHGLIVRALKKDANILINEITTHDLDLIHMIMGISGEAGELLDAIKKAVIYRKSLDRENVIEELGDIEFYLEGLRQALSITRQETLDHNISKLSERYGKVYSDKAAHDRIDKQ